MTLAWWVEVSKNRVSSTYVLISLGASALLFWLFHWLCDGLGLKLELLSIWGENPLLLYVLHYVLLGSLVLPPSPSGILRPRFGWWLSRLSACWQL
jgi:predicted acyltransferase